MSAARLCASALVFTGFVIGGSVKRARKLSEIEQLRTLSSDIAELAVRLEMTRSPLETIAAYFEESSSIPAFWRELSAELKAGFSPALAFEKSKRCILCQEASAILFELFGSFGCGDAAAEIKKLKHAAARLENLTDSASRKAEESIRLTRSVSVLTGLAAALILL